MLAPMCDENQLQPFPSPSTPRPMRRRFDWQVVQPLKILKTLIDPAMYMKTKDRVTICPIRNGHFCIAEANFQQPDSHIVPNFPKLGEDLSFANIQCQGRVAGGVRPSAAHQTRRGCEHDLITEDAMDRGGRAFAGHTRGAALDLG